LVAKFARSTSINSTKNHVVNTNVDANVLPRISTKEDELIHGRTPTLIIGEILLFGFGSFIIL
jgi:hypothetical protein